MPILERLLRFFQAYPLELVAHLSSLVPIVIGGIYLRSLYMSARLIWSLFLFFFVLDTFALVYMLYIPNTLFLQNLEAAINTVWIGLVFYMILERNTEKKLLLCFTSLCAVSTLLAFRQDELSAISLIIYRLFCIIISLAYFNKLLTDMRVKTITRHTLFWFATGLFIYATGTFFIFLFSEYIYDPKKTSQTVYDKFMSFNEVLLILFALMSGYGLWVNRYEAENII